MNVVICGAGVIGASVAYFLAERGVAATLVERHGVACAASGKSGGFIARDWCDGQPQAELARASFDLHADLARTLDADYGYKPIDTLLVAAGDGGGVEQYRGMASPPWLDGRCAVHSAIGSTGTTATIHPERFTRALVDAAVTRGASLVAGSVEGIAQDARGAVRGVRVDGVEIAADAVVIAMGPWSILAARWLPLPAVAGLKGYSVVLAPRGEIAAQALFVEYESASGERTSRKSWYARAARCGHAASRPTTPSRSIRPTCPSTRRSAEKSPASAPPCRAGWTAPRSSAHRPATGRSAPTPCRCSARFPACPAPSWPPATTAGAC